MAAKYPLVVVRWQDITAISSCDTLQEALEQKLAVFSTVGYVLSRTGGVLRLAGSIPGNKSGGFADVQLIPESVILSEKGVK